MKEFQWMGIDTLKPNPKNPNKHSPEQIERLIKLIEYQGWRHPIIVSNQSGLVVVGHGRLEAAKQMGLEKVPVHHQDFDSTEQEYAFLVSDNAIASWAELDLPQITIDIPKNDFDIDLLGIKDFAIGGDDIAGLTDEDSVPETPVEPITKLGDLYTLGNHRVLCGDSTKKEDVERLMNGEKADMVFTSPPYNSGNGGYKTDYYGKTKKFYVSDTDDRTEDEWVEFCESILNNLSITVRDSTSPVVWNVMYTARCRKGYGVSLFGGKQPFTVKETICWDKNMGFPSASKGIMSRNWELIFILSLGDDYFSNQGQNEVWFNRWKTDKAHQNESHKATFPIELAEKALTDFSRYNFTCFDPFLGSGSTLIACEKTNRRCFGMEIDPAYCDVIVSRWEKFTGKKAEIG